MDRYVLRFTGGGAVPEADRERIRSTHGVTVLEDSSRMFLVQATPEAISGLAESLCGWIYAPERKIPVPDARPKLRSF